MTITIEPVAIFLIGFLLGIFTHFILSPQHRLKKSSLKLMTLVDEMRSQIDKLQVRLICMRGSIKTHGEFCKWCNEHLMLDLNHIKFVEGCNENSMNYIIDIWLRKTGNQVVFQYADEEKDPYEKHKDFVSKIKAL